MRPNVILGPRGDRRSPADYPCFFLPKIWMPLSDWDDVRCHVSLGCVNLMVYPKVQFRSSTTRVAYVAYAFERLRFNYGKMKCVYLMTDTVT